MQLRSMFFSRILWFLLQFVSVVYVEGFAPKPWITIFESGRSKGHLCHSLRRTLDHPVLYSTLPAGALAVGKATCAYVNEGQTRATGQSIMDTMLMPAEEHGERMGWGRDAQGLGCENLGTVGALSPSDPRLSRTYAEFPLSSFDELLDLGLKYASLQESSSSASPTVNLVDVGSGCGRLAFYAALTRKGLNEHDTNHELKQIGWEVHGIEISSLLHEKGVNFIEIGIQKGLWEAPSHPSSKSSNQNSISLHCGAAEEEDSRQLLSRANLVFMYSTAFSALSFSPDLGAMILDPEWSQLLGEACSEGCVVITTDRALDPAHGWNLIDRLDVENPEVFGTTGYVQVLLRNE